MPTLLIRGGSVVNADREFRADALCNAMDADIRTVAARLAAESGLPIVIEAVSAYPAQPFDAGCIAAVARAAQRLGHSAMPVVSGAGHDAVYMARLALACVAGTRGCTPESSHHEGVTP